MSRLKKAFTLIEVIVILLVIGILIAFLIPAITSSRGSARQIQCRNNLKQIGIGLTSYATVSGVYPGSTGFFSPLARILPNIDQILLYNSLNFSYQSANGSFINNTIGTFLCPNDIGGLESNGRTNYAMNAGTGGISNAPFSYTEQKQNISISEITDGMSSTVLASEFMTGVNIFYRVELRSVFTIQPVYVDAKGFDQFCISCLRSFDSQSAVNGLIKGLSWARPGYGYNLYNHALSPNSPSCTNGTLTQSGAWSATSLHRGGVNVVFADGHAQFIGTEVSQNTWRALGTMNGAEITDKY